MSGASLPVIVGLDPETQKIISETLTITPEAIETLGDIVSEALDANMEDPTIDDAVVDQLVELIEFLERRT